MVYFWSRTMERMPMKVSYMFLGHSGQWDSVQQKERYDRRRQATFCNRYA